MKLSLLAHAVAILSTSYISVGATEHNPTPTFPLEGNCSTTPPEIALQEYLEHGNNLGRRQVGGGNLNGAGTTAVVQAPAVTIYGMPSPVGTTDAWGTFTYTQTFAAVPDQWPSPGTGQIGLGTLVKQGKREAAPTPPPAGLAIGDPLVLELCNVVVTQPVIPVVEVTEIVEVPPGYGMANNSMHNNHTTAMFNQTTASTANITSIANMTSAANVTSIANTTSTANLTSTANIANITTTHTIEILPSQMNPAFHPASLVTAIP